MKRFFYNEGFRLGILGGGQLGRMLIQEAVNLDIKVKVLDPSANAPCKAYANEFIQGDFNDYQTVLDFGKNLDVLTVEIEHVNVEALEKLEEEGVLISPQPGVLKIIQDKGLQKQFYLEHNIPTSPFLLIEQASEINDHMDFIPCMQKLRKGGYDGRGVQKIMKPEDISDAFDAPSILEEFVKFEKEISVIVARNANGKTKAFPAVELDFNPGANLVEFLYAPASISAAQEQSAQNIAIQVIEAFGMYGILAVEMFLTTDGEILVNESAPRPHNSGHQTIEANVTSQYAQHLRAILDLPLGDTSIISPSVMVNLLGAEDNTGDVEYDGLEEILAMPGVYPHIYGKAQTKPFRKMGHVTIVAKTMEEARDIALKVKNKVIVKSR